MFETHIEQALWIYQFYDGLNAYSVISFQRICLNTFFNKHHWVLLFGSDVLSLVPRGLLIPLLTYRWRDVLVKKKHDKDLKKKRNNKWETKNVGHNLDI